MARICTRYWLRYTDDKDCIESIETYAMNELGNMLIDEIRKKPFGTRWVVSMGIDVSRDPQDALAQERMAWMNVNEVRVLETEHVATPPMTDTEIATMKYNKEPLGKRITGAVKLILGRL